MKKSSTRKNIQKKKQVLFICQKCGNVSFHKAYICLKCGEMRKQ